MATLSHGLSERKAMSGLTLIMYASEISDFRQQCQEISDTLRSSAFGLVHMTRVSETETSNLVETNSTKYCLMPHNWEYLIFLS